MRLALFGFDVAEVEIRGGDLDDVDLSDYELSSDTPNAPTFRHGARNTTRTPNLARGSSRPVSIALGRVVAVLR